METGLVDWRMRLINAVILLRSGGVGEYAIILDAESFGEDSPVMDTCRSVFAEMIVTSNELVLWSKSYSERTLRPVPA